jgi:hypothetical protein
VLPKLYQINSRVTKLLKKTKGCTTIAASSLASIPNHRDAFSTARRPTWHPALVALPNTQAYKHIALHAIPNHHQSIYTKGMVALAE